MQANICYAALVLGIISATTIHAQVIEFENQGIENRIREALDKPEGDITAEEMATIESLPGLIFGLFETFSDLRHCVNLESLHWFYSEDVGQPIEEALETRLEELGQLASLRELVIHSEFLCCAGNMVDISGLETLSNLESLYLGINPLTYAPLGQLDNLRSLECGARTVQELEDVANLTQLEHLTLLRFRLTEGTELDPLLDMPTLTGLEISEVSDALDLSTLPAFPDIEELKLWYADDPLDYELSSDFVLAFPELRSLSLGPPYSNPELPGCYFTDYTALGQLDHLERLSMNSLPAIDLSFVSNLPAFDELHLGVIYEDSNGNGFDFAPLIAVLEAAPRPFLLELGGRSGLSAVACAEQLPVLIAMREVTVQAEAAPCTVFAGTVETLPGGEAGHLVGQEIVLSSTFIPNRGISEEPYALQWYKDGTLLPGETGAELVLADAQLADSGTYDCRLTWAYDPLTTQPLVVNVVEAPPKAAGCHAGETEGKAPGGASWAVVLSVLALLCWRSTSHEQ